MKLIINVIFLIFAGMYLTVACSGETIAQVSEQNKSFDVSLPSDIDSVVGYQLVSLGKYDQVLKMLGENNSAEGLPPIITMMTTYDFKNNRVTVTELSSDKRPMLVIEGSLGDSIMSVARQVYFTKRGDERFEMDPQMSQRVHYVAYGNGSSVEFTMVKPGENSLDRPAYTVFDRLAYLTHRIIYIYLTVYLPIGLESHEQLFFFDHYPL